MVEKTVKVPSPDHPIALARTPQRVVVTIAGRIVADSRNALTMREAAYEPVQYIPREDVDMSLLQPSSRTSYCPYKGDCSYFDVIAGDMRRENATWFYEEPYPAVAAIRDHLAFYPERVDSIALHAT